MNTTHLPLPRTTPEAQGIASSAIAEFISRADQTIQHLHSFMLLRHGAVLAEGWWYPYRPEAPHTLFSLSKSFTSTAVGLAVAEGKLSVEDPVLSYFPEDVPQKISKNLSKMKVRHLLTMTTGHALDTTERIMLQSNPIQAFLGLTVKHEPGTYFVYNSGASFLLAAIIQKLTGQTLEEYLAPRLFEPLGIQNAAWESHPNGINFGGWGLNLKTEDIARFGQLYLQKGTWQGQQLVPAAWVEAATAKQVSNALNENPDWKQGYGYQFWRCRPDGVYRGDGAFGQYCIVMPNQDAVLAITGGLAEMQPTLDLVFDLLLPAMQPTALPTDEQAVETLAQKLKNLALPLPEGNLTSPFAAQFSGKVFTFETNPVTLHSFSLDFDAHTLTYRMLGGNELRGGVRRGNYTIPFGCGVWEEGLAAFDSAEPRKSMAAGTWTTNDTFILTVCEYETPFTHTLRFNFVGDQVKLHFKTNVAFGPTELTVMTGTLKA